jgi:hypothetical protein
VAQRKTAESLQVEVRFEAKKFSKETNALRGQMNANQPIW